MLKVKLESLATYRTDFCIGLLSTFFIQGSGVLFIYFIYKNISSLAGFEYYELLLMYFLVTLSVQINKFLFGGLLEIPDIYVKNGELDKILVLPMHPLLYIVLDGIFVPDSVGVITSYAMVTYLSIKLSISIGMQFFFLVFVFIGGFLLASITLLVASLSFFFVEVILAMKLGTSFAEFIKYPISIYPRKLQKLLQFFFPMVIIALPIYYDMKLFSLVDMLIIGGVTLFIIFLSVFVWNQSIRYYKGTGS